MVLWSFEALSFDDLALGSSEHKETAGRTWRSFGLKALCECEGSACNPRCTVRVWFSR